MYFVSKRMNRQILQHANFVSMVQGLFINLGKQLLNFWRGQCRSQTRKIDLRTGLKLKINSGKKFIHTNSRSSFTRVLDDFSCNPASETESSGTATRIVKRSLTRIMRRQRWVLPFSRRSRNSLTIDTAMGPSSSVPKKFRCAQMKWLYGKIFFKKLHLIPLPVKQCLQ